MRARESYDPGGGFFWSWRCRVRARGDSRGAGIWPPGAGFRVWEFAPRVTCLHSGAGGGGGGELTIGVRMRGGPLVERPLLLEGGDSLEAYVPLPLASASVA